MKNKFFLILFVMCLSVFSGCGKAGAISTYTLTLSEIPRNLDAQVATAKAELIVLTNIFDGLFDFVNGQAVPNLAESYTVSPDGLTYTFKIKSGSTFYKKKHTPVEVTSYDFAFTFERILNPATHSPYYEEFKHIQSVATPDSTTLVITLKKIDQNFLDKLCMPAATPCNQEFFESTKGAYGLGVKNIFSNGPFAVNYLADDGSYATLVRIIEKKNAIDRIRISRWDGETPLSDLYTNEKISGFFEEMSGGQTIDGKNISYSGSSLCLAFNLNNPAFQNENIRKGLAYYCYAMQNSGANLAALTQSFSIFPDTITYGGTPVTQLINGTSPSYMNATSGKDFFTQGLSQIGQSKLAGYTILIPSDSLYAIIFENINQLWQKNLNTFFSIEFLPMEQIITRVANNNFDIAFVNMTPQVNSLFSTLDYLAQHDETLTSYLNVAHANTGNNQLVADIGKAEKYALDQALIVPMCETQSNYWYRKYFSGVIINPFGNVINLKYATVK